MIMIKIKICTYNNSFMFTLRILFRKPGFIFLYTWYIYNISQSFTFSIKMNIPVSIPIYGKEMFLLFSFWNGDKFILFVFGYFECTIVPV